MTAPTGETPKKLAFLDNCPNKPELDFCSRCREHTDFEEDEDGAWRSVCCWALPVAVDVEPDDL